MDAAHQAINQDALHVLNACAGEIASAIDRLPELSFDEWNEYETLRTIFQTQQQTREALTATDALTYAQLESQLKRFPTQPERMMPTRLGNVLRAAEGRSAAKYGLDSIICWPALWLVLPEAAKTELQAARSELDRAAQITRQQRRWHGFVLATCHEIRPPVQTGRFASRSFESPKTFIG